MEKHISEIHASTKAGKTLSNAKAVEIAVHWRKELRRIESRLGTAEERKGDCNGARNLAHGLSNLYAAMALSEQLLKLVDAPPADFKEPLVPEGIISPMTSHAKKKSAARLFRKRGGLVVSA